MSTTTITDSTVTIHGAARDTIAAMYAHVQQIGRDWGERSQEYADAAGSLARHLAGLTAHLFGDDVHVYRDGALSLYVTDRIVYGIIWHGKSRTCLTEGCHAVINDDGAVWSYGSESFPVLDHEHDLSYPLTVAQPGTWSFHS